MAGSGTARPASSSGQTILASDARATDPFLSTRPRERLGNPLAFRFFGQTNGVARSLRGRRASAGRGHLNLGGADRVRRYLGPSAQGEASPAGPAVDRKAKRPERGPKVTLAGSRVGTGQRERIALALPNLDPLHPAALFHREDDVLTFHDLPEHGVLAVEVGLRRAGDEELASVRVGASVRHGESPRLALEGVSDDLVLKAVPGTAGAGS